jgi:hypothetical protein
VNTPQQSSRLSKRVLAAVVVVVVVGAAIALFARRETPTETAVAPASTEQAAAPSEEAAPDTAPGQAADQAESPAEAAKPAEEVKPEEQAAAPAEAAKPAEEAEAPSEAAKPAEQAEAPSEAAEPAEKAEAPAEAAKPAEQAEAPAEETKPAEQAEAPAEAAGGAEGAASAATVAAASAAGAATATEDAEGAAAGAQPAAAPLREALRPGEEPDWPCPQRYTAELSPGAIWTGPPIDEALKTWQNDADVRDLAVEIASDTTEEKEGVQMIDDFAAKLGADKDAKLTELFAGIFDSMNTQRSSMLQGIKRFVKRQETVVQKINDLQAQQQELQATGVQPIHEAELAVTPVDNADVAKMKTLTEQIYWNTRVYDERSKLTPYICDEPIMLESRIGAYARAIEAHLSK